MRRSGVNWEEETMRIASIAASLVLAVIVLKRPRQSVPEIAIEEEAESA